MKRQIISLIVIVAVVLVLGIGVSVYYKMQADKAGALMKTLSSKLISSIMAFGQVKSISGNNLVLTYNGQTLPIVLQSNAKIMTISNGAQKQGTASDLQTGSFVNVTLVIASNYTIQGKQVLILPTFAPAPAAK